MDALTSTDAGLAMAKVAGEVSIIVLGMLLGGLQVERREVLTVVVVMERPSSLQRHDDEFFEYMMFLQDQ